MSGELLQNLVASAAAAPLVDPFGRAITYVRVSVTDRCDFRCVYCMSEDMHFLPKADLLTLGELDRLCTAFIERGTRKLRITGGEPLVRRDIMMLFRSLSRHLGSGGLEELTLTTNGSQLARFAAELADCGVRRINVSLDTLDPQKFKEITRRGDIDKVLAGIDAAQAAGIAVKINTVALAGVNDANLIELQRQTGTRVTLRGDTLTLVGTGFCGALTTFSTFSFEAVRLSQEGAVATAAAYVAVSLAVGLGACAAGWALVAAVT